MKGKSLKSQYRDCYRLERLLQQAFATFDDESAFELDAEFRNYDLIAENAAHWTWVEKLEARDKDGDLDLHRLIQWREEYAKKAAIQ